MKKKHKGSHAVCLGHTKSGSLRCCRCYPESNCEWEVKPVALPNCDWAEEKKTKKAKKRLVNTEDPADTMRKVLISKVHDVDEVEPDNRLPQSEVAKLIPEEHRHYCSGTADCKNYLIGKRSYPWYCPEHHPLDGLKAQVEERLKDHPPSQPVEKLRAIVEERGKLYGDPEESHRAIGLAWEALFRNRYQGSSPADLEAQDLQGALFPADLVALMFAAFKLVRASRPVYHQDSYDDAAVYLQFAERFRKQG